MSQHMWTGGYAWGPNSRLKGDPNAVAATLAKVKDRHGRVTVDGIKDAWKDGDDALRETMGDEDDIREIGLDHMAYKILGELHYEKVNVQTEDAEPGGRVFQPLSKVTGSTDLVRVFVETPREAISLATAHRPPSAPVMTPRATAPIARPVEVLTMADLPMPARDARPARVVEPPEDRDMAAWLALCEWRDRYGDLPRYRPVVAAMDGLD